MKSIMYLILILLNSVKWLESTVFNSITANELLNKNTTSKLLLEVEKLKNKPLRESSVYGRATAIDDSGI
jgi:aminopeptidase N